MKKTHCKNGHLRTSENVRPWGNCIPCQVVYNAARLKAMKKENPEKYQSQHIVGRKLRRYKMTPESYDEIFDKQKGLCLICETPLVKHARGTHIDHNHETDEIRGLLCEFCNIGLGMFRESVQILHKASDYLVTRGAACG